MMMKNKFSFFDKLLIISLPQTTNKQYTSYVGYAPVRYTTQE